MARWSEAQQAAARRAILEAARDAFEAEGYESASMREIASAAGVAVGTLFNYFPDKSTLLREALHADLESVVREVVDMPGDDDECLADVLTSAARRFYDYYCQRPALSQALLRESLFAVGTDDVRFRDQVARVGEAIAARVRGLQTAGRIAESASPEAIVLAFLGHYYFVLISELPMGEVEPMVRRIELLAHQLERGVGVGRNS